MFVEIDGINIALCVPHSVKFQRQDGSIITVEPNGFTLPARAENELVLHSDNIQLVRPTFHKTEQGIDELFKLIAYIVEHQLKNTVIIGSILSAQAYGTIVKFLVPVPEMARMPPNERAYLLNMFSVYP